MSKKSNPMQDERVINEMRKVTNNGFYLMVALLFASIFVKSYILNLSFNQYLIEFVILVVGVGYTTIHTMLDGNLSLGFKERDGRQTKLKYLISSAICGIVCSLVIAITNYIHYDFKLSMLPSVIIPLFVQFTGLIFIMYWIVDTISYKRMKKKLGE